MPIKETKRESVYEMIASNSLALTGKTFIKSSGTGFAAIATAATDRIIGVNETVATFASDNQTVAMKTVKIVPKSMNRTYEVTVGGGSLLKSSEGKFFNLSAADTVNFATARTTPFYVKTDDAGVAVDAVVSMQLECIEYISATLGRFRIVNL